MGAYNATKAAVLSLSETLHAERSGCGVGVAVLCPTFVRTHIIQASCAS
jgi:short-subunit dehydrogenase